MSDASLLHVRVMFSILPTALTLRIIDLEQLITTMIANVARMTYFGTDTTAGPYEFSVTPLLTGRDKKFNVLETYFVVCSLAENYFKFTLG